jgi:hypothetical protein
LDSADRTNRRKAEIGNFGGLEAMTPEMKMQVDYLLHNTYGKPPNPQSAGVLVAKEVTRLDALATEQAETIERLRGLLDATLECFMDTWLRNEIKAALKTKGN